jgi:hypothetical protein
MVQSPWVERRVLTNANSSATYGGQRVRESATRAKRTPQAVVLGVTVEGVDFMQMVTHIDATGKDIVSIHSRTGMMASEVGEAIPLAGICKLTWHAMTGETFVIEGQAYVAVRKDSPNRYDFALVPSNPQSVPPAATTRRPQQLTRNADSAFVAGKRSEISSNAAWLCKLGPAGESKFTLVDW